MSNGGGAVAAILGLVLLSGCVAEERARAVRLDKGGYAGTTADQAVSDATREALRQRVAPQAEGAGKVMVSADAAVMPTGDAAASGRIAGQKF
ncbi:hypothetical protein [Magnetospirillum sp. SS-4]|uniref:hypothetical protein n=1 Tax=Magnetospirillum sp. SS-4 TaxID=2681465 RepID=UPI00137F610B|nr:hypothetical protein [Magnetospirillum sp. SS-4]CAA7626181.1 conserved exported hypothetical protein [Magnetospirillum sp. SS-4]